MTLTAKDLAKEYPRGTRETLAGHVLAARVLDKCRSTIAGSLSEYHFDRLLYWYFLDSPASMPDRSGLLSPPAETVMWS